MIYLVLDQCFPMRQIQTLMMTWSCPMLPLMMNQAVLESGKKLRISRNSYYQSSDRFWHLRCTEKSRILSTDIEYGLCWWQVEDFGDRSFILPSPSVIHRWSLEHIVSSLQSPSSFLTPPYFHQHQFDHWEFPDS